MTLTKTHSLINSFLLFFVQLLYKVTKMNNGGGQKIQIEII